MPAYIIVGVEGTDQARYDGVPPAERCECCGLQRPVHGARRRSGDAGGTWLPTRLVVIAFASVDQARAVVHLPRIHRGTPAPSGSCQLQHARH